MVWKCKFCKHYSRNMYIDNSQCTLLSKLCNVNSFKMTNLSFSFLWLHSININIKWGQEVWEHFTIHVTVTLSLPQMDISWLIGLFDVPVQLLKEDTLFECKTTSPPYDNQNDIFLCFSFMRFPFSSLSFHVTLSFSTRAPGGLDGDLRGWVSLTIRRLLSLGSLICPCAPLPCNELFSTSWGVLVVN